MQNFTFNVFASLGSNSKKLAKKINTALICYYPICKFLMGWPGIDPSGYSRFWKCSSRPDPEIKQARNTEILMAPDDEPNIVPAIKTTIATEAFSLCFVNNLHQYTNNINEEFSQCAWKLDRTIVLQVLLG